MRNMLIKVKQMLNWHLSNDDLRVKETYDNLIWLIGHLMDEDPAYFENQIECLKDLIAYMEQDYPEGFFD